MITMENGKNYLLYDGFTFFYRYKLKTGYKWVCTNYPRCKAYLCVDDDYYLREGIIEHNSHIKKKLVRCPSGKYTKVRDATFVNY